MKKNMNLLSGMLTGLCLTATLIFTGCNKKDLEKTVIKDIKAPEILSATPVDNSSVATNIVLTISFSEEINPVSVTSSSFGLKQGSSTIPGTVSYNGKTATFTPAAALDPNKVYTAIATTAIEDIAGNPIVSDFTWSFTTSSLADIIAPAVVSVSPVTNATSVSINSSLTVTFSEIINASTVNPSFTLKKGSTIVQGNSTVSGAVATFTPSSALTPGTVYTATLTTGIKDMAGNSLASNYSWNFTTGATATDVTAPTVTSVSPAANATSVSVASKPAVTLSEAVNPVTVTSSSFILKQGSAIIAGSVSVSGSVATFTPASALTAGTLYTVTLTTGIKDIAGNSLASNYSWSFTTAAAVPTGKSFSADVVPVLNLCNTCHTHGWTPSGTASTFHANLLSKGYISTTNPTSGKIYQKLSGSHPPSTVSAQQKSTVMTWITEGSKNN